MAKSKKKGPVPHKISARGLILEAAHNMQQGSNVHAGTSAVIGQDADGKDIRVKIGSRCPKCQRRVRSPNHAEGMHHRGTVKSCSR